MDPAGLSAPHIANDEELYIDTPEALATLVSQLSSAPWLAVDTEFLREKTYHARLCLLQLGGPGVVACIDPLALQNLDLLRPLLCNRHITKVLHAARQDLEILYQVLGEMPTPVFDTQIAAAFLGQGEQIGYGRLVAEVLAVSLEKGHARTDWSKRPLDPAQLHYAANDVRYLGKLYTYQHAALSSMGRLTWLNEYFSKLCDHESYRISPEDRWRRLKGIRTLRGAALAIAQDLAAWREIQARAADRPRRWILADEPLLDIARRTPTTPNDLQHIHGLPRSFAKRHGDAILELVAKARSRPAATWPVLHEPLTIDTGRAALADQLMATLRYEAQRQAISPALLATRSEIEKLACGETDLPVMQGWRAEVVGKALRAVLRNSANAHSQGQGALGTITLNKT